MANTIGVRKEDKNKWETRVPLVPEDVRRLTDEHGLKLVVQESPTRCYRDDEYRAAGAKVEDDLSKADVVLAVKEIPTHLLRAGKTYLCFAHVVKGQAYNMPTLARMLELGCTLLDYEKITDAKGRRLLFFGKHAGNAGMIDTLRTLGLRLQKDGVKTPLAEIKPAYEYRDLADAKNHLHDLGARLAKQGLPEGLRPLVIGVAGYGNVARGVQEILECLPIAEVPVADLPRAAARRDAGGPLLVQTTFKEEHMARPKDPAALFELQEYYAHPERYVGTFEEHLPHLDVLVNTIYWEPRYPRLVTAEWTKRAFVGGRKPRLKIIGDISCDIGGSIELTLKSTAPDAPSFVYDPATGEIHDGYEGQGPIIMAVDNLPCELPREASGHFSSVLKSWMPALASADWQAELDDLAIPAELRRAIIVHKGKLTPSFKYLEKHLAAVPQKG